MSVTEILREFVQKQFLTKGTCTLDQTMDNVEFWRGYNFYTVKVKITGNNDADTIIKAVKSQTKLDDRTQRTWQDFYERFIQEINISSAS